MYCSDYEIGEIKVQTGLIDIQDIPFFVFCSRCGVVLTGGSIVNGLNGRTKNVQHKKRN